MAVSLSRAGFSIRSLMTRLLAKLGLGSDAYLILVAVIVGMVTAAAAVGFHTLISAVRDTLYSGTGDSLYGEMLFLLVLWPTLGGLAVGVIAHRLFHSPAGHGVVDVMESVIKSNRFVKPGSAIEKILTSAITIGSGGAVGAEGPIVQIGAAISTLAGKAFGILRPDMPTLIGCGTAAGISAIFNSPIGGLLFTLEVILQDFSLRTITPIVIASVIANTTTQGLFRRMHEAGHGEPVTALFNVPSVIADEPFSLGLGHLANFVLLGILCGVVAVLLTRSVLGLERRFSATRINPVIRPAVGGLLLGLMGLGYILFFRSLAGWQKPIPFSVYPMPGFYGDGYAVIEQMLNPAFTATLPAGTLTLLLGVLLVAKILGTSLTLGSGGSGGVIAPALFVGAAAGAMLGIGLKQVPFMPEVPQHLYPLVGMGAALAAVVHAPLASVLILAELTADSRLVLPAMLATVVSTGVARLMFADSVYTYALRRRGLRLGGMSDPVLLRRLLVEQVVMEPAELIPAEMPLEKLLKKLSPLLPDAEYFVVDSQGRYYGSIPADALINAEDHAEAVPLLTAGDLIRPNVPYVLSSDTLATVQDYMLAHRVRRLAVCLPNAPARVIGQVSHDGIQQALRVAGGVHGDNGSGDVDASGLADGHMSDVQHS